MSAGEILLMGGGCGFIILLLRLVLTGRWLAASIAVLVCSVAWIPFLLELWRVVPVAAAELAIASALGVASLLSAGRWLTAVAFVAAVFAYAAPHMLLDSLRTSLPPLALLVLYLPMIALASPPLFMALASVFFADAFMQRRTYRTAPRAQAMTQQPALRG